VFLTRRLDIEHPAPTRSRPAAPWHRLREYKMFASQAISTAFPFFVRRRDKNIVSQSCLDISFVWCSSVHRDHRAKIIAY
jgi:hypothetical protein